MSLCRKAIAQNLIFFRWNKLNFFPNIFPLDTKNDLRHPCWKISHQSQKNYFYSFLKNVSRERASWHFEWNFDSLDKNFSLNSRNFYVKERGKCNSFFQIFFPNRSFRHVGWSSDSHANDIFAQSLDIFSAKIFLKFFHWTCGTCIRKTSWKFFRH